jgi:hypothetical protein
MYGDEVLDGFLAQCGAAHKLYSERFHPGAYNRATEDKSVRYCKRLIDVALALCGHPM